MLTAVVRLVAMSSMHPAIPATTHSHQGTWVIVHQPTSKAFANLHEPCVTPTFAAAKDSVVRVAIHNGG